MKLACLLDTGVLSRLVTSNDLRSKPFVSWFLQMQAAGHLFVIPEIAYYELRRELVRIKSDNSRKRLDALRESRDVVYLPITTAVIEHASALWALARNQGRPMAHEHALDGDVILAAQARSLKMEGRQVVVITTNKKHLSLFVDARLWDEVDPDAPD